MQLLLIRDSLTENFTLGKLYVDGAFFCDVLEDAVRKEKIKGETAIPAGAYDVILTMSNRFKKVLPLLLNVPNYEGVRIHSGNTQADTEGCLLVGVRTATSVKDSRVTMTKLMAVLKPAKKISIVIR